MVLTSKEAVARFKQSEERTHILVNDPDNRGFYTTDTTPEKNVETYPHFITRITRTADGVVAQAAAEADRSGEAAKRSAAEADRAGESAEDAAQSAREAWRAVESIPGIESAQFTINALSIEDGKMLWAQAQDGDTVRPENYDWVSSPEHAAIYYTLNSAGEIIRHIPVAPPAI